MPTETLPISLEELQAETVSLPVAAVPGLVIDYRPWAMTPAMEDAMARVDEDADAKPSDSVIRTLSALVAGWNLPAKKRDTKPMPVTDDTLRRIPSRLVKAIITAIGEHQSVPNESAKPTGSFA